MTENFNIKELSNTIFFGDRIILKERIKKSFDNFKTEFIEVEKLNIQVADIRNMISFVNKTSEKEKIVLLSSFYWSSEVQNAMLKVLEDTPANARIFLFGLSEKYFLPTVLSRMQKKQFKNTNRFLEEVVEVFSLPENERLESKKVKKLLALKTVEINTESDKESEKKDRESHVLFLQALLEFVLKDENYSKLVTKKYKEKILKISYLAETPGGSPHMFIEWLLLTLPKI